MASEAGLPAYVDHETVLSRLPMIFPKGTQQRTELTNKTAARTVFAMLYTGALVGTGRVIGPKHVYGMTDEQALKTAGVDRLEYAVKGGKQGGGRPGNPGTRTPRARVFAMTRSATVLFRSGQLFRKSQSRQRPRPRGMR